MKQRQNAQHDVVRLQVQIRVLAVDLLGDAGDQALVSQDHALGQSSGTGRERQRNGVVGADLDLRRVGLVGFRQSREMQASLRGSIDRDDGEILAEHEGIIACVAELIDVLRLRDDNLGFGGVELLEDLFGRAERVGGGGDGADHGSSHESEDKLGAVLEERHDDVAFLDSELGETGGDSPADEVSLGEGVRFSGIPGEEARAVGELRDILEAVCVEREVVGDGNGGEFGHKNMSLF